MDSESGARPKSDAEVITIESETSSDGNVDMRDNLANSKRKLENGDQKEQKPHKRAKLIYHVDRIKREDKAGDREPVEPKTVPSSDDDDDNSVGEKGPPGGSEEQDNPNGNRISASGGEHREKDVLKDKCISECLTQSDEDLIILENDVGSDVKANATPNKENNRNYSLSGKKPLKRLTPKQLVRRAEIAKKREEREMLQQEKQRMKKERQEEKFRIRKEKEEEKKKLREEKEKKRQAEIEIKNEEKRKKEEERRRKEEQKLDDKRKKEEQQRKKEEEEELLKKKHTKAAEAFSSFFKKCDVKATCTREDGKPSDKIVFMPFTVKADMRLAPINRNPMSDERRTKLEELCRSQSQLETYLSELRSGSIAPRKDGNTWPLEEKYPEVVIVDGLDLDEDSTAVIPKRIKDRRPKLLQFSENRRPPYWGTWRKKSKAIRARNPLGKDEIFDYDVDSDDEWEEEEPGESLHGSDDEKESEDEYEVDNDFFVPHGYLSDDENPEGETLTPETQKAKLKLLGEQFDLERNEKTKLLKPITLGCIWFDGDDKPDSVNASVVEFLNKRKAVVWTDSVPIPVLQEEAAAADPNDASLSDGGTPTSSKKVLFPDSAVPELIGLVHGSANSRKNLVNTFLARWTKKDESEEGAPGTLSKAVVARKIKELGKWQEVTEQGPNFGKWCWYVKREVRERFGVPDPPDRGEEADAKESDASKTVSPSLITKFTKILTEDERRSQLAQKTIRKSSDLAGKATTTPKSLKCVSKLRDFWAKPSLSEKYSVGASVSADDEATPKDSAVDVVMLDSDSEDEDNASSSEMSGDVEMSNEEEVVRVAETDAKTEPAVKKRAAILMSAPRGSELTAAKAATPSSSPLDRFIRKYENSKKLKDNSE